MYNHIKSHSLQFLKTIIIIIYSLPSASKLNQRARCARGRVLPKKSCNKPTTPLKYTSFAIRVISLDRQTVSTLSCHENISSPTNEMRFTDRKKFFTELILLLRSVRSVGYDRSCHENILIPTNEMQFTDRKKFFTDRTSLLICGPYGPGCQ